ncbi:MAG TPA: SRPBCC family protein [Streptosporangiaceae bacterium]|nr:SRPBCC family protein [Streptosporangiaceae bacterium]
MTDPIDPIDRLAILAAALPGAAVAQRRIAAPFDAVWRVIADMENATPRYEPGVAEVRVIEQSGEFLRLLVRDTAGREDAMDARLRPGWCLMQSATIVIAFAARGMGDETLLAHLEHRRARPPVPGRSGSDENRAAVAKIDQELRTIERLATHDSH